MVCEGADIVGVGTVAVVFQVDEAPIDVGRNECFVALQKEDVESSLC